MKKKTSKKLALIIAATLSISMITSPVIQAVTVENPQAGIEAASEFSVDDTSFSEETTALDSLENEQNMETAVETNITAEEQSEGTIGEDQIAKTDQIKETIETDEARETTETNEVEQATEIKETTEKLDNTQSTTSEQMIAEGTCGKNLTWYLTDTGKLCINGTGKMDDYLTEELPWEKYTDYIEEIYLSNGITSISDYAFFACSNLSKITLPESLTAIGHAAFASCSSLNELIIPQSVTTIGENAFFYCENLTKITLPENLKSIGYQTFIGCSSLSEITLPQNLTAIGHSAFMNCKSLSKITFPQNLTSIDQQAFGGCSSLSEITLPQSLTTINSFAFNGCSNLSEIILPQSLTTIGEGVFFYCENLMKITLPENLTTIENLTFGHCSNLSEITLPENLTTIREGSFSECSSLKEIIIPKSVTSIGEAAFSDCDNLSKITILNKNCKISPDSEYGETISNIATIYGYTNSTAQTYAEKYNKKFEALDPQANTYTITYNANGGKNAPASQTKEKDKTLTLSETKPTRTGYTFLGWATSKTSTKATYMAGTPFNENENMTFYAVWKANTYKIAFKPNGGTGSMTTISCTYDKSYTLKINTFKRTGYTFKGWNTKADGTGMYSYADKATLKNASVVAGKTMNFYAQWSPTKYTITYQLNGGTNNKANPASYKTINSTITLKNPSRKGYTFAGWYTSSIYKTKVTKITKGSSGNKTLYAKWTPNKYKIAFHKNGGTGSMATISCTYDKSYTLKANTFKRTGYTFKGWNTKADGTGMYSYADKATLKNASVIAGKTMNFYAQWTPNKYKITYQLNEGTNNKANPTSYKITNSTITLKNPTRKGYTFAGWYTNSSYRTKVTKITKGSSGNKTLYAKWIPITYTISYNKNGATKGNISNKICSYNSSVTLASEGLTRNGYVLAGWSKSKNGAITYKKGETVKNLTSQNGKKIVLYAVWQKKLSKISNKNFGTHNTSVRRKKIKYIAIHYTGLNKDAQEWITLYNQRSYTRGSADYFVGYSGQIYQYNPDPSKRYCWSVGGNKLNTKGGSLYGIAMNSNTINIEMCVDIPDGVELIPNSPKWILNEATLNKTVLLTKELMLEYNIPASNVIRHYDVTGKLCPGMIGWNEDSGSVIEWKQFKSRIS